MTRRALAAAVLGLAGNLLTASCVQGSQPAPDTPALSMEDEDDPFGGDPDIGSGIGAEPPAGGIGIESGGSSSIGGDPAQATGSPALVSLCLALAPAGVPEKEAFCRSLADIDARARCWSHRWSRAGWTGWCYFEFT